MAVTKEKILDVLKKVKDPGLNKGLVELGMIKDIEIAGSAVRVTVALTMSSCPNKNQIKDDVEKVIHNLEDVSEVKVILTTMTSEERAKLLGQEPSEMQGIEKVKRIIAIASGKGGVGKTTVSVNLAIALSKKGFKVGILDADMHGPDVPIMLGIDERPLGSKGMLLPIEKFGLKIVSTATLAGEGVPIVWRGPLVTKAVKEFLGHVAWGELDYLLVDLPPGTGDAPLTMAKLISLDGVIIVTTPQKVALADVRRCVGLFVSQNIPIFGIVENMSFLRIPGVAEGQILEVFGSGGGEKIAKAFKAPLLGKVPLDQKIREGGDTGKPMALNADSECAKTFDTIAEELLKHIRK
ncbi:MAG: Mrp/NBP35 family ATP-binding protein [Deltaproteobacteria bacterium]|nr:Mrp/NBP35 family ATP-binding protein [Deltaproteobacteria bacterium]MBW1718394.1 Mrp/NBP35 family ATP-binding protein [Deltaproteobacteria bacterium]MBW1931952.1 Mrp/NBP35 family ATP-binding protein [Deltaproteobacteria bacterium]MBW1937395.1 Mrp/NBP35 family ATP-binding protein [Deltaproteobacteria bacterium]MBW1964095.1 Mrp/NBP35 family ATP-binding protein [Deltaproteobacteria bacterium]